MENEISEAIINFAKCYRIFIGFIESVEDPAKKILDYAHSIELLYNFKDDKCPEELNKYKRIDTECFNYYCTSCDAEQFYKKTETYEYCTECKELNNRYNSAIMNLLKLADKLSNEEQK